MNIRLSLAIIIFLIAGGVFTFVRFENNRVPPAINPLQAPPAESGLTLFSFDFEDGDLIPSQFTCDGSDINPGLAWENVPKATKSLALIVDDPDAPGGRWLHWLLWNISPAATGIGQGQTPPEARTGTNDFGLTGYKGPCPPRGSHRYFFRLYALDNELELADGARVSALEKTMAGHILATAELMGRYR